MSRQQTSSPGRNLPGGCLKSSGGNPHLRMVSAWDRYWFRPVAAIRPYLLMKGVLFLLAFDAWVLRVPHGGRYGDGGFNVAHFQWLDALQPLPSPELYVGLMLSVGMLALVCMLTDASRWALALLALMWTYGWAMSLHDTYQHHYFLSLVLTALVFFPRLRAQRLYPTNSVAPRGKRRRKAQPSSASRPTVISWTYALLGANVAIVYAFTAVTKLDIEWRTQVFRQLVGAGPVLGPLEQWFAGLGVSGVAVWGAVGLTIFTMECLVAVGYVLAVRLDENPHWWLRVVTWLAFVAAVGFHISADVLLRLRIGWFSYYMILLACIYFLPKSFLWAIGTLVTWPTRLGAKWSIAPAAAESRTRKRNIGLTLTGVTATAIIIGSVGFTFDLPGAATIGVLAASALVGVTLLAFARGQLQDALRYILATALAGASMWAAIGQSTVRFQYYGLVADHRQLRGDLEGALEAYERAIRYVPDRERSRVERIVDEVRRQLGRSAKGGAG